MTLYLLPGVGCDHRLFGRLELAGMDVRYLEWPPFPKGCTLEELAQAMRPQVAADRPHILGGVSMGGMVAQELALLTHPRKVILISTWEGPQEFPWHVRVAKVLGLGALIGGFTMRATWPMKRILGQRDRATDRLLFDMAVQQTATKIRHGVQAVLRWNGSRWGGPVVRIHGSADHVIPLRFPADHVVPGGAHIMVLTRAAEISQWVRAAVMEQS
jgi:pimeloyl-ACP methyl ester carboxylesterase